MDLNNPEWRDAFDAKIERIREIFILDPEYDDATGQAIARDYASKFATPDTSDSSPLAMRKGGCK